MRGIRAWVKNDDLSRCIWAGGFTIAWTETARRRYCRVELRCASNLTDAQWSLIEPFMPAPSRHGRPRSVSLRVMVEAILYMRATGCQ